VRRTIAVVIAAASLGAVPATAAAAASHKFTGPGVKLTVHGRIVQHFQIKLVYVCGPTGGQRVPTTLKLSGLALTPAGKFSWHFEQGPLIIAVSGKISGRKATGSAAGFGDVGAGSSDCGTGRVDWTASRP
jgi:hypothetical protein